MNIAITGGAGFIGKHLIRALKAFLPNAEIRVLDNFCEQIHDRKALSKFCNEFPGVDLKCGSITVPDDVNWLVGDAEVIFHLAAETGTGQSMYSISRYSDVNIMGTSLLLEALLRREEPLKHLILASSRSIYGEGSYATCERCGYDSQVSHRRNLTDLDAGVFDVRCSQCGDFLDAIATNEKVTSDPRSYYALTKLYQEMQVGLYADKICEATKIFRFQNVYGPGQSLKNPYTGILAIFSGLAQAGAPINVFEDGEESRDFIWVEDVARTLAQSISCEGDHGTSIYNLGTGVAIRVLDIAEKINDYFGGKSEIKISGDFRQGDIRHNFACIEALKNHGIDVSDFRQFDSGLLMFLDSIEVVDDKITADFDRSMNELKAHGLLMSRGQGGFRGNE